MNLRLTEDDLLALEKFVLKSADRASEEVDDRYLQAQHEAVTV
jgi:hypothetical protein